jgi:hypothetical protein
MGDPSPDAAYAAEIAARDEERNARLRSPDGWLALVGLHWLTDGTHGLGSDPDNPIHLIGRNVPAHAGWLVVADGRTGYRSPDGTEQVLADDRPGPPTIVELGSLRMHLIRRGERLGLRVRDAAASVLESFPGISRFPVDPAWRIPGRLERPPGIRTVDVPDVLGDVHPEETSGVVHFRVDGQALRLDALPEDEGCLWLIFGDTTNGAETYSGGRFLVSGPVAEDGSVEIDFNKAYNPPCVWSRYATCPLPWPENRLPVAIRAGETMPAAG